MRTIRTAKKRQRILEALAEGLTVLEAARRAGCGRAAVFQWKADDPEFAGEFNAALDAGTDVYEHEARRRAFRGSDALLIFLLKSRDPHRFNRRMIGVGQDEQAEPVKAEVTGEVRAWIYPRPEKPEGEPDT